MLPALVLRPAIGRQSPGAVGLDERIVFPALVVGSVMLIMTTVLFVFPPGVALVLLVETVVLVVGVHHQTAAFCKSRSNSQHVSSLQGTGMLDCPVAHVC